MDRTLQSIVRWAVVAVRDRGTLHAVVAGAPHAHTSYSDGFFGYQALVYGLQATHTAIRHNSET